MKCPRCEIEISDQLDACPACHFTLEELDAKVGKKIPRPVGVVHDFAQLLDEGTKREITRRIEEFQRRTGGEFLLVTVETTAPLKPSEYLFWLFNRWDVGGERNRGLMILVAKEEHRIECEVGYSLEFIVSDEASGAILDEHVVPFLKKGKFREGLYLGVDILAQIVEQGLAKESFQS